MQILEMRSAIDSQNQQKGVPTLPDSIPDWAVRTIFERRNGLELTPLPQGIERRSFSDLNRQQLIQRAKMIVQQHEASKKPATDEADRDRARLRLAVASLL